MEEATKRTSNMIIVKLQKSQVKRQQGKRQYTITKRRICFVEFIDDVSPIHVESAISLVPPDQLLQNEQLSTVTIL